MIGLVDNIWPLHWRLYYCVRIWQDKADPLALNWIASYILYIACVFLPQLTLKKYISILLGLHHMQSDLKIHIVIYRPIPPRINSDMLQKKYGEIKFLVLQNYG